MKIYIVGFVPQRENSDKLHCVIAGLEVEGESAHCRSSAINNEITPNVAALMILFITIIIS